jgi:ABC-type antimicrobial peptide transport system permease subunit
MLYLPMGQHTDPILQTTCFLVVRSLSESPTLLTRTVEDALTAANPSIALSSQPLATIVDESLAEDRLMASLSGVFGALGLGLSSLGLYGIVAYAVVQRRREIAVRLALGATRGKILTLMLRRVSALLAAGGMAGLALSVWSLKYIASLFYDLQPGDPATLGSSITVLFLVGLLAAAIPAIRASRLDPADGLRDG